MSKNTDSDKSKNNQRLSDKAVNETALSGASLFTAYACLMYYSSHAKLSQKELKNLNSAVKLVTPDKEDNPNTSEFVTPAQVVLCNSAVQYSKKHRVQFLLYIYKAGFTDIDTINNSLNRTARQFDGYSLNCIILSTDIDKVISRLNHDIRLAKHGFVLSALNDIFKNYHVNHKNSTDNPRDMVSILATSVMDDDDLTDNSDFFVLDSVIQGCDYAINHGCDGVIKQVIREYRLKKLADTGQKYVVCTFHEGKPANMHKVTKHECVLFIKQLKHYLFNHFVTPEES